MDRADGWLGFANHMTGFALRSSRAIEIDGQSGRTATGAGMPPNMRVYTGYIW